ncbi:hypothetical protein L6Q21_03740 [Sandaracinobacter sp. RS1-74]|nr:hypothetical protein [Sandaracinobacteroides sayramensis]MCG2840097.1 hypothetical protein [Sandaracinobacteroides sayramensis]
MEFLTSPTFAIVGLGATLGWVFTTWLRVKHGYPLEGSWGQALKPAHNNEQVERLKLLTSENAQLQAELGALKDRVQTLERIATDGGSRLSREIDDLRH